MALRCQASRVVPVEAAVGPAVFRAWIAVESFVEAGAEVSPEVPDQWR